MQTIIKADIAKRISEKLGLSVAICEKVTTEIFESMLNIVSKGSKLHIKNFGAFELRTKSARPGRDIGRNKEVIIEGRTILRFCPARTLKNLIK